ncbi:hypothetical protein CLV59_101366 [Chitinophaga dinghuensis]|uniref:Fibronectin type-III domain-containing protein n=1 Tax=Chitinophaga dinghuensis TaxID=1539050 RepID=A0A327WAN6_9BACT|nr:hypothetical protein [Chitinophaga dinghuensis]RAJ87605.1 hypothetical protein CLV59_101366 [Chitinophaga dinghuensis]
MNLKKMKYLLLICLLLTAGVVSGQKAEVNATRIVGRAQAYSIKLRWAVTNARAWKLSNQYGFQLTRYTILRDGKMLTKPEMQVVKTEGFRPRPLDEWETIANKDNYAAVIAQALYGKDFDVSGGSGSGVAKMINQATEADQRFSMSLYAADNSFDAAVMAGWGYEDKTARPNEKYLYRLTSMVPANKLKIDTSSVYIGINDFKPLPKPGDIGGLFGNRSVILSWDYTLLQTFYTSYVIECSKDSGKTFEKLPGLPVTNFNKKDKKASPRMYYIDSLADNNHQYQYRIKGVSPFGEVGPASNAVVGKGVNTLAFVPNIRTKTVDEKNVVTLTWEFEAEGNKFIKGFRLNRANKANGAYTVVVDNIAPTAREITYDKLFPSNYFTITAVAKEGESTVSFPVLVQPIDSVPPAVPTGLVGIVDSTGIVTLTWKANTEPDILGYKVFRANRDGEELVALVDSVHHKNTYRDSIGVKNLNSKVYYTVAALDRNYNQSANCPVVMLKKPDLVPPASPVITGVQVLNDVVALNWEPSHSEDVAFHIVYRKEGRDSADKWLNIQQLDKNANRFTDKLVETGKTYFYLVIAKDSSGLESIPVQPVTAFVPLNPKDLGVRSFDAYVNKEQRYIELFWKDNVPQVAEYQLYKGVKGKGVTLWKIVRPGQGNRIVDDKPAAGATYEYGIRIVSDSGAMGKYKSIEVIY